MQDVHWDRREIEFVQTVGRLHGASMWGSPKTEAGQRSFPITAGVRSALVAQKAAQEAGLTGVPAQLLVEKGIAHGPLVFVALDGGPLNGSVVTHRFGRLLRAAGIAPLRVHDLRHLFVSMLFAADVPLELISGLLGHASPQVRRTAYLHLRTDRKARPRGSGIDCGRPARDRRLPERPSVQGPGPVGDAYARHDG